ncbi:MAG: 30S ribosome-binding factor RbfA [Longimicrobiales bacterium]|nr:30S ribosome-binding factor RbfA [Longimicrobiales bacterium]
MSKRIARLNEQLKRELSELIRTQVRDPRVGIVTITGVEVARDLGSARIFVRDMGGDAAVVETLKGLEAAAPFLRSVLGRLLHVRKVPELRFREDRSYEGAMRIDQVLLEVLPEASNVTEAGSESDETDTREAAVDSVDQDAVAEAGNA